MQGIATQAVVEKMLDGEELQDTSSAEKNFLKKLGNGKKNTAA